MMNGRRIVSMLLLTAALCLYTATGLAATLTLPASLTVIDEEAFYGAQMLDEVVLPEGIERIESRAFAESTVSSINLPESIEYIADDAFDRCGEIEVIARKGSYAYQWAEDAGLFPFSISP